MTLAMLELAVIVIAGIVITSVVYEVSGIVLRHLEDRREQERADQRARRRRGEQ